MTNTKPNFLYCFISHQPMIKFDIIRITKMMEAHKHDNYIICYGGDLDINIKHPKVRHLDCPDDYCSLPNKINSLYKYIIRSHLNFDFIVKIDRTMKILQLLDQPMPDYSGQPYFFTNKKYHFNRCIESSIWYNREFDHPKIQYCIGYAYILSKKAISYIGKDDILYLDHVYEDLYVGSIMYNYGICPIVFDLKPYFYDSQEDNNIPLFYEDHIVDKDFDVEFYQITYPETKDFYQPYCIENNIDDRHRLFYHYKLYGSNYFKNLKEKIDYEQHRT